MSKEVVLFSDLGCPLFAVRAYRSSGSAREGHLIGAESTKSATGRLFNRGRRIAGDYRYVKEATEIRES